MTRPAVFRTVLSRSLFIASANRRSPTSTTATWLFRIALTAAVGSAWCPRIALAAGGADAKAQQMAQEAIFDDYLRLDFKKAARKLRKALGLCDKGGCSPTIEAQILRDLAVVYVTGQNRRTKGRQLLVEALVLDPRIALDSDLTTPELVKTFKEAQQKVRSRHSQQDPEQERSDAKRAEAELASDAAGSVDCPPDFPGCESLERPQEDSLLEEIDADELSSGQWLSVSVQQDLLMLSGETGVCLAGAPDELSCYRSGGDYREAPDLSGVDSAQLEGGEIQGGFRVATTRLLFGYERQIFLPQLRLGGVLGYAFWGGPSEPGGADFLPFHVELNGRYAFSPMTWGITPFVSLAAGVAQVDASVVTDVVDRNPNTVRLPGEAPLELSRVTVWKKTGTTFGSLGAGARYRLGDSGELTALGRLMVLFPSSGAALSLQLGYTYEL